MSTLTLDKVKKTEERYFNAIQLMRDLDADITEGRREDNAESRVAWDRATDEVVRLEKLVQLERKAAETEAHNDTRLEVIEKNLAVVERELPKPSLAGGASDTTKTDGLMTRILNMGTERTGAHGAIKLDMIEPMLNNRLNISPEIRTILTTTNAASTSAGALIDIESANMIYDYIVQGATILNTRANVIPTMTGVPLRFPRATAHVEATLTTEGGTITDDEETYSIVTFNSYNYKFTTPISYETLRDESVGVIPHLMMSGGRALGLALGKSSIQGTGTSQPAGLGGVTLTSTDTKSLTTYTYDGIVDKMYLLPVQHRRNAEWLLHDDIEKVMMKIKDSDGRPIWNQTLVTGTPAMVLGHPIHNDPYLDATTGAAAANIKTIGYFGDMSAFCIRVVGPMRVDRDDSVGFKSDTITYRWAWAWDSDIMNPGAIVRLRLNALT